MAPKRSAAGMAPPTPSSFVAKLHKRDLETLRIPSPFYSQLQDNVELELLPSKQRYFMVATDGTFRTGWKTFCKNNSIKDGDTIVFHRSKHSTNVLTCQVFGSDGCEKQEPSNEERSSSRKRSRESGYEVISSDSDDNDEEEEQDKNKKKDEQHEEESLEAAVAKGIKAALAVPNGGQEFVFTNCEIRLTIKKLDEQIQAQSPETLPAKDTTAAVPAAAAAAAPDGQAAAVKPSGRTRSAKKKEVGSKGTSNKGSDVEPEKMVSGSKGTSSKKATAVVDPETDASEPDTTPEPPKKSSSTAKKKATKAAAAASKRVASSSKKAAATSSKKSAVNPPKKIAATTSPKKTAATSPRKAAATSPRKAAATSPRKTPASPKKLASLETKVESKVASPKKPLPVSPLRRSPLRRKLDTAAAAAATTPVSTPTKATDKPTSGKKSKATDSLLKVQKTTKTKRPGTKSPSKSSAKKKAPAAAQTPAQAKALDRARGFTSANPHHVFAMKKSNLAPCFLLSVPTVFAKEKLPNVMQEFEMLNDEDKAWNVRWLPSPKMAFSGGWIYFAQDNKLQTGDACVLELLGSKRVKMHIFRASESENEPLHGGAEEKQEAVEAVQTVEETVTVTTTVMAATATAIATVEDCNPEEPGNADAGLLNSTVPPETFLEAADVQPVSMVAPAS